MTQIAVLDASGTQQEINELPSLGEATKANSLPMTLATDDPAVETLGSTGDTAYSDNTLAASGTLDAILKGVFGKLASLATTLAGILTVQNKANVTFAISTGVLGAGASYIEPLRYTGAPDGTLQPYAYFNSAFYADQAGTAMIYGSPDNGTTLVPLTPPTAVAANTAVVLDVPVIYPYNYGEFTNTSTTAQTVFRSKSSYTGA